MPNNIHPTALIHESVHLGDNNQIGAYCVIGYEADMRGNNEYNGKVLIGNNNRITDHVVIHRGKEGLTEIGDNNLIMAQSYIAHNVKIGNNVEVCPGVKIGGFAIIGNDAKLKLGCFIRNRVVVGEGVTVGMGSNLVSNVSNGVVMGNPAK